MMKEKTLFVCIQKANQITPDEAELALDVLKRANVKNAIFGLSISQEESLHPETIEIIKSSETHSDFFFEFPLLNQKQFYKLNLADMIEFFNKHNSQIKKFENAIGMFTPKHKFNVALPDFLVHNNIRIGTSPTHIIDTKLKAKIKAPIMNINWGSWLARWQFGRQMDKWKAAAEKYPYLRISLNFNDLLHPKIAKLFIEYISIHFVDYHTGDVTDLTQLLQNELNIKKAKKAKES
jgi:predicted deacetylase